MTQKTYTLEFITPCFCAGADPSRAEIRAPSIRGQLRWWFRALGGNPADETKVFGSVAGDAKASAITIRLDEIKNAPPWTPPADLDIASDAYVYYFASVSGTSSKGAKGPRWTSNGAIPPKSTFRLIILQKRGLPQPLQEQFDCAVRCFLQLGAIGLRVTRGLGSFFCHEQPFTSTILEEINTRGFNTEHRQVKLKNEDEIAREIGSLLKGTRKATKYKFDTPSPFGMSTPRQTSAIYFRPVRSLDQSNQCTLVIFEAPHQRVLGKSSQKKPVIGQTPSKLEKPAPARGDGKRRYDR
jgi:CRISPR type III-B/RAMP module RAMP protein Cmr1